MDCEFNEDYYERGIESGISGYSNFRWIPELTIPLCFRIIELLDIQENDIILDFGCAKGYLVKGFRLLHREAYGVDISDYAISQAPGEIRPKLFLVKPGDSIPIIDNRRYDYVIAKDVLEHVPYEQLSAILQELRWACRCMFVVVPLGENGKFNVPAYENDVTHIIREPLEWWRGMFEDNGFSVKRASYKVAHIKSNWAQWEKGNGFFVLE